MPCLRLEKISFTYPNGLQVLNDLDVQFERGQMYAIIGPSGTGKTTLLSLLGGLDKATSGKIEIDGEDIKKRGYAYFRKHSVSFVFQSYNLIDYLTAEENVRLVSGKQSYDMLERVGLTKDEGRRNTLKLSGGQQQRVAIARALASTGSILLADEPTGNLDEATSMEIVDLLLESAHKENKCVVVVTHSHDVARKADLIYQIRGGKLEEASIL